jgi:hypothetical protein
VLLEVGPQHWGTDRFRETPKRPPSDKLELIDGGGGIYRDASEPALSTWRRVYYIGKRQAANTFIALSRDASLALENTDIPALRDVPPDTTRSRGLRWVWTVFDLAWQKSPGTALKADKRLWCGTTKFPHVQPPEGTFFRKLWDKFYEKGGWGDYPPDCFCSELNDVFTSSAYACDIMLSLTDEQVEAKISEARNVDRLISAELRKSLAAFKAYLETGVRCKRSVPNVGDVDCVEISGDDAVEQLQALRHRLRVVVEQAFSEPGLRPTADLLTTNLPSHLLGPDHDLNLSVPPVRWGRSGKFRPFAEFVRADVLDVLDKALARLKCAFPTVGTAHSGQRANKSNRRKQAKRTELTPREQQVKKLLDTAREHGVRLKQKKLAESLNVGESWISQIMRSLRAKGALRDSAKSIGLSKTLRLRGDYSADDTTSKRAIRQRKRSTDEV